MQVIANAMGFHGSLRQPGDSFEVPDDAPWASWFAPKGGWGIPDPRPVVKPAAVQLAEAEKQAQTQAERDAAIAAGIAQAFAQALQPLIDALGKQAQAPAADKPTKGKANGTDLA